MYTLCDRDKQMHLFFILVILQCKFLYKRCSNKLIQSLSLSPCLLIKALSPDKYEWTVTAFLVQC